jgi:DNA repair protein RadD
MIASVARDVIVVTLRPYQLEAIEGIRSEFRAGHKAVLFVLATGGGKTTCFSFITQAAAARGNRVLILVHRVELLDQASRSLTQMGVPHGLIAAGRAMNLLEPVQVGSIQTVARRLEKLPGFQLVVVDEAHHTNSRTWAETIGAFRAGGARVLGVTATPVRTDGQGLGAHFEAMILGPSAEWLTANGYLARARLLGPPIGFSAEGIGRRMGDFDMGQAEQRLSGRQITGDAVSHYRQHLGDGTAIAFCCSVAHAEAVARAFEDRGIAAASIDGRMDAPQRRGLLERLGSGDLKVLTSCALIGEGVDVPSVGGCILLRPTQSLGLHLQMIGRALRPSPGKDAAVVLDHVGNLERLGSHLDEQPWSLEGKLKRSRTAAPSLKVCPKCFACSRPTVRVCTECGHEFVVERRELAVVDGQLQEYQKRERRRAQGGAQSYAELVSVGMSRGMKNPHAWANHVLRARSLRAGRSRVREVVG